MCSIIPLSSVKSIYLKFILLIIAFQFMMRHSTWYIICFFILSGLWVSCANIMAPTGGPKDEKAPLLRKRSLQDSALNFRGGKIQFEFDEFLQLKDVENQLVITPLLSVKPKVTIHKKRATIYLADSLLQPNTTYKISFGNAIQDLHEGNAVKDLLFTFSTGSYFDSLVLNGMVYEAETGKPDTAGWVMLYSTTAKDSAFYKQKPLYAQRTNNGVFRFENMPDKEFYIYSLRETNNNLKYDAADERISFYRQKINPADSQSFITLYSFTEKEKIDTNSKKSRARGNIAEQKKSNIFGYNANIDTIQKNKRTFDISDSILITFTDSILNIDQSKIRLFQGDNFDATAIIFIDTSFKKIIIKTDWVQDASYTLNLLKSFAENKQKVQASAASFTFKTKKESDYGFLTISAEAADEHKIISLYKDEKLVARKTVTDTLVKFPLLSPGNYQLRILDDKNKNGVWDTGNLHEKLLPEIVTLVAEPITIKANWGNKISINTTLQKRKQKGKK